MERRAWLTDSYAFKSTSSYLMLRQIRSTNTLSRHAPFAVHRQLDLSPTGGSFDGAPPALNTSAARSCNCRFHSVIWFGCTPNCCASPASVRSPLTAASATFALNAAECVRRVLFVIFRVPLPALSLAQAPAVLLIRLSERARPPLYGQPGQGRNRCLTFQMADVARYLAPGTRHR